MWNAFLEFWSFSQPNVVWVLFGSVLLAMSTGVVGVFAFLRKQALTGDALAHAALPGVTTAFLFFHTREPIVILGGALVSCLVGYFVIEYLVHQTRIKQDSALAIVLSLFFAVGIFQLTYIQHLGLASQAGLDKILFGQAASLVRSDVILLSTLASGLLLYVFLVFEKLKMISFDRDYAAALGINVRLYEASLAVAIVLSVTIGLQLVGVVLMAAMLLTPAAAARYWTERLVVIVFLAGVFGALSGVFGANISYLAPRMPTGPWMVIAVTAIFFISLLFAQERGVIPALLRRRRVARRIQQENILRTLYKIYEQQLEGAEDSAESVVHPRIPVSRILTYRDFSLREVERRIESLELLGFVDRSSEGLMLTAAGLKQGKRLTRFHRLWELYLSEYVRIAPDHVHDDAEEIEHFLTGELAMRLESVLGTPAADPHGKSIPGEEGAGIDEEGEELIELSPEVWVILIGCLVGISCSIMGVFLVLRKLSMLGDAISHSILFGIIVVFLLTGSRSPLLMFVGAGAVGLFTAYMTSVLHTHGRLQEDASIGVTFTWLFAMGVILISVYAGQVDLDQECVLYGEIAFAPFDTLLIGGTDIGPRAFWMLLGVTLLNVLFVALGYKSLKTISFDPVLAASLGFSVPLWHYLLMSLVSLTTVASFESVGAILVVALLVIPANTAYLFVRTLFGMLVWSCLIAVFSAIGGYYLALWYDASVSAAMAIVSGGVLLFVLLFVGSDSVLSKIRHRRSARSLENSSEDEMKVSVC